MTLPFLEKVNAETSTKKIIQKKTSQDLSRNSKGYHHKI